MQTRVHRQHFYFMQCNIQFLKNNQLSYVHIYVCMQRSITKHVQKPHA